MRAVLFGVFFLSGFAALLYQVVWQRVLAIFSGADVYAVTVIVAAFMAGLGVGNLVGGYLADRLTAGRQVLLFAAAELAIALFAWVSLPLYYDVLYLRLGWLAASPPLLAGVLVLSLLWPTFFMGLSLPLLARGLTARAAAAPAVIGWLYAVNTLGAAVGAAVTTWIFSSKLGFETTVLVGGAINVLCAVGALAAYRAQRSSAPAAPRDDAGTGAAGGALADQLTASGLALPSAAWFAIYALSGFVALGLEIVWFRFLGVMLKSNSFTFGHMLSVFLTGLAVGTALGILHARRSTNPARDFLILQAAIGGYAALSLALLTASLGWFPPVDWLWRYLGGYAELEIAEAFAFALTLLAGQPLDPEVRRAGMLFIRLYLIMPALVIGPPTLLMGLSFPLLQRVVQRDLARLGRRVGFLQTANIAGSMAGTMLTGWLFLPTLGTAGTVRLLLAASALFLLLAAARSTHRAAAVGLAVLLAALVPGQARLWAQLHGAPIDHVLAAEDGSGVSALVGTTRDEVIVFANGLGQGHIPFDDTHVALGLLPVMLHPAPRDIALVGLGSAGTLFGAAGRDTTTSITCIEIVGAQHVPLRALHRRDQYAGLDFLYGDSRIRYVVGDGRAVLRFERRAYDLIEADALRPTSAYSGNLYSREYFELLRAHLKPGGYAVTWAPTARTSRTFISVFPHVLGIEPFGEFQILIGSDAPIAWDEATLRTRLSAPAPRAHFAAGGVDVDVMLRAFAAAERFVVGPELDRARLFDLNGDLFPRDEYLVPDSTER